MYFPFPYAPTPCMIADTIPLTSPGMMNDINAPLLSRIPFLLIFFVTNVCKIPQKKLVSVPIAMGYAGLKTKSTLELKAIAPYK